MQPLPVSSRSNSSYSPGALVEIRGDTWKIKSVDRDRNFDCLFCVGVEGITRGHEAYFLVGLEESSIRSLDPIDIDLVPDESSGYMDSKLYLEAVFRSSPPVNSEPLLLGKAAIDDLEFQHAPVQCLLEKPRARLLIADDVGLGKTMQAGLATSELILRGRANRILVVTTRAMLQQFQMEFWTRFSIPLARLDGNAIRRMRSRIPSHYNLFDQFERAIVSIDTLKTDSGIRTSLEKSRWDLIIIDEAHNAAKRRATLNSASLRARLADLLSRRTDSLLLLTATPHDGSNESFSSLVAMLDPSRVPNSAAVRKADVEDLIIRRFRTSPEVKQALKQHVPQRNLEERCFALNKVEDEAYRIIAELELNEDQVTSRRKSAIHLFRTTLAKAIFSSPAACLATVEGKIKRIERTFPAGSQSDLAALKALSAQLQEITPQAFSKYQNLLRYFSENAWSARNARDRIVIFSERLDTLKWLENQLKQDLHLDDNQVGRVDGRAANDDEAIQKLLEDFGQRPAPIRILLASDMASEGLNLHFQCYRLIHFDLPWSLLRFQQRNGRIDRYGQDREPNITYFVAESTHQKVQDMWVLDKLVEKDAAAQAGAGDPAVFLGVGDADREEEVVAEAVACGAGGEALTNLMNENEARAESGDLDGLDDFLTCSYAGTSAQNSKASLDPLNLPLAAPLSPRLFDTTFDFVAKALTRFSADDKKIVKDSPIVKSDENARTISFSVPETMRSTDHFGYDKASGKVDHRYMPSDAVSYDRIVLTDRQNSIKSAIELARLEKSAWPTVQYLWDTHPILEWVNDSASQLFDRRKVPCIPAPRNVLANGNLAAIMHSVVTNRRGMPLVDQWGVVVGWRKNEMNIETSEVMDITKFLNKIGFNKELPNPGSKTIPDDLQVLQEIVDKFKDHFIEIQTSFKRQLEREKQQHFEKLDAYRVRFDRSIDDEGKKSKISAIAEKRMEQRRQEVNEIFQDWDNWYEEIRDLTVDRDPFVDIVTVFWG